MKTPFRTLALTSATVATSLLISLNAMALSVEEGTEVVAPFYEFLSNPGNKSLQDGARNALQSDWRSYYNNQSSKGVEETIQFLAGFGQLVPDLNWEIKDIKIAGDTVIVRGEATGTPAGDFFGVPHKGNSFKIMSIDMHTIENGKVKTSYHIEDWASAMKQLSQAN